MRDETLKETNEIPENFAENLNHLEQRIEKIKVDILHTEVYENALQTEADNLSLLVSTDEDLMIRYQENLLAFKEYHPEIYDFFKNYEPEKYIVDAKDGFINALNVETGDYFYKYPSFLSTKVQFDKFKRSPNIKKFNFNRHEGNEAGFLHVKFLDEMLALIPEKTSDAENVDKEFQKNLSSLMIFGVGSGYHLELFVQQYNVGCIYIIEPDLDLFFLSFFSINWLFVLKTLDEKGSKVFISLGEQQDTFFDDLMTKSAINGRYQMSSVAGYIHYKSEKIELILTEFNRRYLEMGQGWGFFDDAVISIGHMLGNLKQNVPLLKNDIVDSNEFFDTPVFILGNGPSLDGLIDTIKLHQDKAIIISCGTALSALYKYGITPDFHCEQERTLPVAEKVEHCCPASFLKDTILLAPATVHPAVFSMFKRTIMAAKANEPSSALLLRDIEGRKLFSAYHFINPTVANTALAMGYHLGFKNFYLFGVDLGQKEGGNHHSKKSLYYTENEQDRNLYYFRKDALIESEGNFGGKFFADHFFHQSNVNLSKMILAYQDLNCFNLSDGAKVVGSKPMSIEGLDFKLYKQNAIDKIQIIDNTYKKSIHYDKNQELLTRLVKDLDYQYFDDICQRLITFNESPITTFKEATQLLSNNTLLLSTLTEHANNLIHGTIMQMQVILTHLLYDCDNEKVAIERFIKGLVIYRDFIKVFPRYYREHAENAHILEDTYWLRRLREK